MMDQEKTKNQLISELEELRKLNAELALNSKDLKIAEIESKKLADEFESILDHLPALVFYKDKHNNFIHVNKYLADAHNLKKEELEGKNLFEIYPADQAENISRMI